MNRRRPAPAALLALTLAVLAPVALSVAPAQAAPAKPRASSAKAPAKRKTVVARRKSGKGGNSLAFARSYKRYRDQQLILHTGPVTGPMFSHRW